MTLRERIRFWFDDLSTPMGRATDLAVFALIVLGCFTLVLETYSDDPAVVAAEWAIMGCFIVEYLLRLWAAERRLQHVFTPYALIDLAAIVPSLFMFTPHLQVLRVLRVIRVIRLLRFIRDRHFFFGSIRQGHLDIIRIAYTLFAIIFITAGLIWHVEQGRNSGINTFGDAFYFSVVMLTTVGFGDITPVTLPGRWVCIFAIWAGIIFIPWQIRDMIAHATEATDDQTPDCPRCGLRRHHRHARYCRRCGKTLAPP